MLNSTLTTSDNLEASSYLVRDLSLADLNRIVAIEKRNFPSPWKKEMFEAEFSKPIAVAIGIETEGEIVGYLFGHNMAEEFHILTVCIDNPHRRKGLGSVLLQQITDFCRDRDVKKVWLEVRKGNLAARKLYERSGFAQHSVRRSYYSNNGEDALVLLLDLI